MIARDVWAGVTVLGKTNPHFWLVLGLLVLGGCSVLRGAASPATDVNEESRAYAIYLTGDVLWRGVSANAADREGMTEEQWRDNVIAARLQIIDQNFQIFKDKLRTEITGLSLGTDLAALGLTAASGLSSGGTAKALAAASTGVIGAGTAFNKDALYQQTLPAIFAQMDADRTLVLARIRTGQASTIAKYPLAAVLTDITAYERAGTIEAATATLTQNASKQAQDNKIILDNITLGTPKVDSRYEAFRGYIQKLSEAKDLAKLTEIAKVLRLTVPSGADYLHVRALIFRYADSYVYSKSAEADKLRALDELAKALSKYVTF